MRTRSAVYASGHLLFVRGCRGSLAQGFDLSRLERDGQSVFPWPPV